MSFYFAWVKDHESFDARKHARHDESILHFDVDHQEGAIPLLRLTIPAISHTSRKTGQRGLLWQQEREQTYLLFDGILVANPAEKKDDFLLLILEAGRSHKVKQLEKILNAQKNKGFEPLLVAAADQEAVEEVLEAVSALPHWDRVTGTVTLIDPHQSREVVDMGSCFFAESLELRQIGRPLSAVRFSVTAEWVQRYDGVVDLSPLLQQEGRGYFSTLTPEDLYKRWWRKEYPLHRTGYEILESRLIAVTPPSTGGLNVYSLKSASFTVNGQVHTLTRTWLQPSLRLQWHYRQKRKETVHVEVPCGEKGEVLELAVRLQDICSPVQVMLWQPNQIYYTKALIRREGVVYRALTTHFSGNTFDPAGWKAQANWPTALEDPSQWSFFETPRGRQVIEHVIQQAEAYGAMAAREIEVKCRLPFAEGRLLRGNEQVRLKDHRLPEGAVIGQIVHYQLVVEGDTGECWASVTLAVTLRQKQSMKLKGLRLLKEAEGIRDPRTVMAQDLVRNIEVTHGAEAQNRAIEGKSFASLAAVHRVLEKIPTRVKIELNDLKPTAELSHEWEAILSLI